MAAPEIAPIAPVTPRKKKKKPKADVDSSDLFDDEKSVKSTRSSRSGRSTRSKKSRKIKRIPKRDSSSDYLAQDSFVLDDSSLTISTKSARTLRSTSTASTAASTIASVRSGRSRQQPVGVELKGEKKSATDQKSISLRKKRSKSPRIARSRSQSNATPSLSPPSMDVRPKISQHRRARSEVLPSIQLDGVEKEAEERTGLDELISQSVEDHVRESPPMEKPSLRRSKSKNSLGELFRRASFSEKIDKGKAEDGNSSSEKRPLVRSKSALGEFFNRKNSTDKSVGTSTPSCIKSMPAGKMLKLPKSIKEIDGQLWRVDEKGNKIKRVRRKSTANATNTYENCAETTTGHSVEEKVEGRLGRKIRGGRRRNVPSDWSLTEDSGASSVLSYKSNDSRVRTRGRPFSREALDRLDNSTHGSDNGSLSHDEIPSKPRRSQSNEKNSDAKPAKRLVPRPKRRPSTPRKTEGTSCLPSSSRSIAEGHDDQATAMQMVAELQKQLMESKHEVWRLKQVTAEQKEEIDGTDSKIAELEANISDAANERKNLVSEVDRLSTKLELREQDLIKKQEELEKEKIAALDRPAGDHLVAQITELMNENNELMDRMTALKLVARQQKDKKDEELRFLKSELDRLRAERDQQNLEKLRPEKPSSMQLVDKIWNQKRDATEQSYRRQIQDLRDRVRGLEASNGKLKRELGRVTVEIKSDDDEETRKAKEMARAVSRGRLTRTRSAQRVRDRCERQLERSKSPHANGENKLSRLIQRSKSADMSVVRHRLNRNNDNRFCNSEENWWNHRTPNRP